MIFGTNVGKSRLNELPQVCYILNDRRTDLKAMIRQFFMRRLSLAHRCVASGLMLALASVLPLVACGGEALPPSPQTNISSPPQNSQHTIYVVSNGWHSSIVLARADLAAGRPPEAADFPDAGFLEFGWGDGEYYPAKQPTFAMTLRAALVPTPSVMHVAGLGVPPAQHYTKTEVIELTINTAAMGRLVAYIDNSFARAGQDRAVASGPGLYAYSRFYPAVGDFSLATTCNTWTARALVAAGLNVDDEATTSVEDLMSQLRNLTVP